MEKNSINIPYFLEELLLKQYSEKIVKKIEKGYLTQRKLTFRINTLKTDVQSVIDILKNKNISFDLVNWNSNAIIIKNAEKSEIENLDIYKDGKIYLQSLSSMLPPILLNPQKQTDILDMCAAPGGKTTQLAAITENDANITACEMNLIRLERLKYNVEKQGATCVYIMQKDARKMDDFFSFDSILLDAPCSGSGILSINDKNLEKNFTIKLIEKSIASQTILLEKALKILKHGKEMVYSTCSVLKCENEDILKKALSKYNAEIVPIEFEGMYDLPLLPVDLPGTLCLYPTDEYEGFFVAKIKKNK